MNITDTVVSYLGKKYFLGGGDCFNCKGIFFLPATNSLEIVLPKFCPYCGIKFIAMGDEGGPIEPINTDEPEESR